MRISTLTRIILSVCVVVTGLTACEKDDPATLIPPPIPDQICRKGDTVANAFKWGWCIAIVIPKGSNI